MVYDSATVTGAGTPVPTGTVTYVLFTNSLCSGSGTSSQTVALSNGLVPHSFSTTLATGSYSFSAAYSGDSNYLSSTGTCEPFAVVGGSGGSVGGVTVPVEKLALLAPYFGVASIITASALALFYVKRRPEKGKQKERSVSIE